MAARIETAKDDEEYAKWRRSTSSRILVLSGQNDVARATHCWATPIALDLISEFTPSDPFAMKQQAEQTNVCAFYLLGHRSEDDTPVDVLALLIYHMLHLNKRALQSDSDGFWRELQQYEEISNKSPKAKGYMVRDALDRVILEALNTFRDDQTVWIVLDRVDKCCAVYDAAQKYSSPRRGRQYLLKSLVKVVKESTSKVKVLAIVNRTDWRVEEEEDYEGEDEVLVVQRLDQSATL